MSAGSKDKHHSRRDEPVYAWNSPTAVELNKKDELIQRMLNDMQDFVDKCDRGEARSKRSYAAFKHCIELAKTQGLTPTEPWK